MRLFVISLALLFATASTAHAKSGPNEAQIDSDGKVPVRYNCISNHLSEAMYFYVMVKDGKREVLQGGKRASRLYHSGWEIKEIRARIRVNVCYLRELGGGPNDLRRIVAHERAHANGWEHGDGSPRVNAAYYPKIQIRGN